MKLPTIQLDQNNERIIPDPVMPIADTTKIPWTVIFVSFLVSYFIFCVVSYMFKYMSYLFFNKSSYLCFSYVFF